MAPRDVRPSNCSVNGPNVADPQSYSHAVSVNGAQRTIYTSGLLGQHKDGSFPGTFGEQALLAVQNFLDVIQASGATANDIVKLTFYIVDWNKDLQGELLEAVMSLANATGGMPLKPTTTLVPVANLAHPEAKFEMEAVLCIGGLMQLWAGGEISANRLPIDEEVDVVVVGGGFSGCMAAYDMHKAGLSVILLEAKHRIGGKSRTHKLESGPGLVELGATWINQITQPTVYELTKRFGLVCKEQYIEGDTVWELHDGSVVRGSGLMPEIRDPEMAEKMGTLMETLAIAAEKIDIRNFESFPENDDVSVSEWLTMKGLYEGPLLQGIAKALTTLWVGREPRECGIHYILDYVKSAGGLASINTDGPGGAQDLKIKQGTSAIATSLAGALKPGSVKTNTPVDAVSQYGDFCIVTTSTGTRYKAKKVVIAIPTNTYTNIRFSPPLPSAKKALVTRTKPGVYAKVIVTYSSSWWKDAGLQGKFMSVKGPICCSWDISDDATKQYSLALFVVGDIAAAWHRLSELGREEAILEHLATLVGPQLADKARNPLEVTEMEWTKEAYLDGAPTSVMGPGMLKSYGQALREPFHAIHFVGAETAYEWKGYLEGAIRAGNRGAEEVIKALKS
ncbi:amine oxidase [Stemphylium lycopersici]|nr:amine oxidase [Stemphylium lycopersici]